MFNASALTPNQSARHFYGAELRRHRDGEGWSLSRACERLLVSKSTLARLETAEVMPQPGFSERADHVYATEGHFLRLYGLVRKERFPDKYRRRMELEERARVIEEFAGHVVPGLLQTPDYARALFRASNPKAGPEAIEDMVSIRTSRQDILLSDARPDMSAIIDEAVLRRPVGGRATIHAQLAQLASLARSPRTTIQVLPFAHGEHALLSGSLTLLTLPDARCVAYEEGITTGFLLEDAESVIAHRRSYDLLRAYALTPPESAALIQRVMEDYRACDPLS